MNSDHIAFYVQQSDSCKPDWIRSVRCSSCKDSKQRHVTSSPRMNLHNSMVFIRHFMQPKHNKQMRKLFNTLQCLCKLFTKDYLRNHVLVSDFVANCLSFNKTHRLQTYPIRYNHQTSRPLSCEPLTNSEQTDNISTLLQSHKNRKP